MPVYTWLRPRSNDSINTLNTKRRAAQKLKALRAAFKAHVAAVGVQNLDRDEYNRWMRLTTGDPNFGRRGY